MVYKLTLTRTIPSFVHVFPVCCYVAVHKAVNQRVIISSRSRAAILERKSKPDLRRQPT